MTMTAPITLLSVAPFMKEITDILDRLGIITPLSSSHDVRFADSIVGSRGEYEGEPLYKES